MESLAGSDRIGAPERMKMASVISITKAAHQPVSFSLGTEVRVQKGSSNNFRRTRWQQ